MPAKQPEHSRRQRGYICSRAPHKQVIHLSSSGLCWQSSKRRHSFPTPRGTAHSPPCAAQHCTLLTGSSGARPPAHLPGDRAAAKATGQKCPLLLCTAVPLLHSGIALRWCKHPKCSTDTKELLGGTSAQLQLAQADPASLRAPALSIRFTHSP